MNSFFIIHDVSAKDLPKTYDNGKSDVMHVFTSDGQETTAVYRRDGYWEDILGGLFGNVTHWVECPFPHGFKPDNSLFGGEDEQVPEILKEIRE